MRGYLVAVAATAVAVLVRGLLNPWLGPYVPFATLFGAVAVAVWVGGYRPALVAAFLGFGACSFLFVEGSPWPGSTSQWVGLAAYLFSCGIIIGFGEALHAARRRAEAERLRQLQAVVERSQAEAQVVAILENMTDGFLRLDRDWRIVEMNPEFERHAGRPRADQLGKVYWDEWPALRGTPVETEYRKARTGQVSVQVEHCHVAVGRWYEWKADPTPDGGLVIFTRDISDRKRADAQVRERAEELQTLLDALPIGVFIAHDLDCRRITGNQAGHNMLRTSSATNLSKSAAEHERPMHFRVLHHGVEVPPDQLPVQQAARGVSIRNVEYEIAFDDGSVLYTLQSAEPLLGPDGSRRGAVGSVLDVTDLRRAERQLQESEQRLRLALTAARMVAWEYDPATEKVVLSDNAAEVLALPPGTPLENSTLGFALLHPDDVAVHRTLVTKTLATGGSYLSEYRQVRADGSVLWLEERGYAVSDGPGGAPRLIGVVTDITERKQAQDALAQSADSLARERERLAIALRTGELGVYEWLVGTDRVWWSPEVYPVYGVDPATFTPTVEAFTALVHPDDRDELWRKTEESLAQRTEFTHEYRIRRPDGTLRWIANRSHISTDSTGRVERLTGVAMDITERKQAEQELHRLNAELRQADRRKDEFIATLAHELRNPLAPIRNAVQVLKLKGPSDPGLVWCRDVIDRQVGQMARLLDDLLNVSRITRGKLELRKERVALVTVVETAVETSRPLIDGGGHTLTVELPPEPIYLNADTVRLAQVFANLLNNAAKYSDQGGQIRLSAARASHEVVVRVRDHGIGIDPEVLPRLFEMFSQATPALERSQGGLGIGLALARGLVELHGGQIEAHSAGRGQGSEFLVRLPVAEEVPVAGPLPTGTTVNSRKCRILVADDLQDSADSLAMLLTLAGHEVRTAYDAIVFGTIVAR